MVESFYDKKGVIMDNAAIDGKWTPAEVNQILFRNFKSPETALYELNELTPNDLYGFRI
jgi:hypothetical protein